MKDKILVIGSGLLGRAFFQTPSEKYIFFLAYRNNPLQSVAKTFKLDITNSKEVEKTLSTIKPDCIINTAAFTNVDLCEKERAEAEKVNIEGPLNISEAANNVKAKLIHISTDFVFDGKKGNYSEEDKPNPLSWYGRTKLEGEEKIAEKCKDFIIARTSVLYGWNSQKKNFATWVVDSLKKQERISLFSDQYTSPTYAPNLAESLLASYEKDLSGLFHASGSERIDRFDFGMKIAEIFSLDKSLISKIKTAELSQIAERPKDSSLNISKFENGAGIKMLNVKEGLMRMKKEEI